MRTRGAGSIVRLLGALLLAVRLSSAQDDGATTAFLGVSVRPVSPETAAHVDLPQDVGLTVWHVIPGSPAAEAGLQLYDILTEFDDQLLVADKQLTVLVRAKAPHETVTIRGLRHGAPFSAEVILDERPANLPPAYPPAPVPDGAPPPPHPYQRLQQHHIIIAPQQGGAVGTATRAINTATRVHADGEHTLQLTERDGKRHLTARNRHGAIVFDGPVDTDEQRQRVPAEIRAKLDRLEAVEGHPPQQEGAGPAAANAD